MFFLFFTGGVEAKQSIVDCFVRNIYFYFVCIRTFTDKMKREAYERQKSICAMCGNHFDLKEMEADHIIPWSKGGRSIARNCQMLCRACNRKKGGK